MKKTAVLISTILLTTGCASKSSGIKAKYVSHTEYMGQSCDNLDKLYTRVSDELSLLSNEQDSTADKDAITMGASLLLFPPAALYLAAGENQEEKIADLKGKRAAIREAEKRKKCY